MHTILPVSKWTDHVKVMCKQHRNYSETSFIPDSVNFFRNFINLRLEHQLVWSALLQRLYPSESWTFYLLCFTTYTCLTIKSTFDSAIKFWECNVVKKSLRMAFSIFCVYTNLYLCTAWSWNIGQIYRKRILAHRTRSCVSMQRVYFPCITSFCKKWRSKTSFSQNVIHSRYTRFHTLIYYTRGKQFL